MKNKAHLILEFGERSIKICECSVSGRRVRIDSLQTREFSHDITLADIEAAAGKLIKGGYEKIIISLPRVFFMIRFLQLPSQNRQEIERMLAFQLSKIIPSSPQEVCYSFSFLTIEKAGDFNRRLSSLGHKSIPAPLAEETVREHAPLAAPPGGKDGFSEVVVFLVPDKKIAPHLEFIKKHKITPALITMSSYGLYKWWQRQKNVVIEGVFHPALIIDIDKYHADFLVIEKKTLIFSRSFFYSDEAELLEGINHSLVIFEKKFGKQGFSGVAFTGNEKRNVSDKSGLGSPVFIDFKENFSFKQGLLDKLKISDFSYASILGLATENEFSSFDFSPEFVRRRRNTFRNKRNFLGIITVILEIIIICGLLLFNHINRQEKELKFLDGKLKTVKTEAKELDALSDNLTILQNELAKKISFSEIIFQSISALPEDVQLSLFDFQEDGDFSIKGYAGNESGVFLFASSLSKAGAFRDVRVKYTTKIKRKEKTYSEFLIEGRFNK